MAFPDRRTLNVLMTALLFGLVLAIVYVARAVIVIFAFSILFAYLINPIVRLLQRHSLFFKNLRGPHVAEAYLTLLFFLGLIIHSLAPQLVPRVERLVRDSPAKFGEFPQGIQNQKFSGTEEKTISNEITLETFRLSMRERDIYSSDVASRVHGAKKSRFLFLSFSRGSLSSNTLLFRCG